MQGSTYFPSPFPLPPTPQTLDTHSRPNSDFIFGQHATAWFDQCSIRVLSASLGYITASGRPSSSDPSYYVIDNSTVAAAPDNNVPSGPYYLGRPWADYARVVFQDTSMTSVINAAGWHVWSSSTPNTDHVLFGEYGNTGRWGEWDEGWLCDGIAGAGGYWDGLGEWVSELG